jgi:hypothetical protein
MLIIMVSVVTAGYVVTQSLHVKTYYASSTYFGYTISAAYAGVRSLQYRSHNYY